MSLQQNDLKFFIFEKKLVFLCSNVFLETYTRRVEDFTKKVQTKLTPNTGAKQYTFLCSEVFLETYTSRVEDFTKKEQTKLTPNTGA